MFFLIDKDKKICLGWSTKCGCNHVKHVFKSLIDQTQINQSINIHKNTRNQLHANYHDYTIIVVTRNPYERLVSGFLDKFNEIKMRKNSPFFLKYLNQWRLKKIPINFSNLVYNLGNWKMMDRHHFNLQLSEAWKNELKIHYLFDIENINYTILEQLFNKKIPEDIKTIRHNRNLNRVNRSGGIKIFDKKIEDILETLYSYDQFYNDELKEKTYDFYKKDFLFLKEHGFYYDI